MADVDRNSHTNVKGNDHHNTTRGHDTTLKQGDTTMNDERNIMQTIEKLYQQNIILNKESKQVSETLSSLLKSEKTSTGKDKLNKTTNDSSKNKGSGSAAQKELQNAYQQISSHQKALKALNNKVGSSPTYQRYKDLENTGTMKDMEVAKLEAEKHTLERTLEEKKRAIQDLNLASGVDTRLPLLQSELSDLKKKHKESVANEKKIESDALKDNTQIAKLREELSKNKESYRYLCEKTAYNPVQNVVVRKPQANPLYKRNDDGYKKRNTSKKEVNKPDDLDKMQFSQQAFQKLYEEVREMKRNDAQREADHKREMDSIKKQIETIKKETDESMKKLTDKEKEANILTIKLRELHRIAQFHSLLPKDDDETQGDRATYRLNVKASALLSPSASNKLTSSGKLGSPSGKLASPLGKLNSPQSTGALTRPKLSRLDSLNGFAKDSVLYKGFRKDERGKIFSESEGEFFSDKDAMHAIRPKIIGLKIWHDNRRITGFQAMYRGKDGKDIEGAEHARNPQAYKLESFELSGDDYIKEISGFMGKTTEQGIECLMLMSARGETKKILEPSKEGKLFKFDINELEYPSIIYGYLRDDNPRNYITKFGVLIASEDIEENLKAEAQSAHK